eukprot:4524139-Pleurochrysis_carterae.AAC.2
MSPDTSLVAAYGVSDAQNMLSPLKSSVPGILRLAATEAMCSAGGGNSDVNALCEQAAVTAATRSACSGSDSYDAICVQ